MKPYPDYIKRWSLVAVAAALIIWTGCSDDIELPGNNYETTYSDSLIFTTGIAQESTATVARSSVSHIAIAEELWTLQTARQDSVPSRGTLTNLLDGKAGVLGFQYGDDGVKTPIAANNNVEFKFSGDELLPVSNTILWNTIVLKHLDIYSYAPYLPVNTDNMKLLSASAPPQIDYIVPDQIADQQDLLVSKWISAEHENPENPEDYKFKSIHLTFHHALTAIRFRVGFECTVKSVEIKNVYNHGEYNFLQDDWTVVETPGAPETPGGPEVSPVRSYKVSFGEDGKHFGTNQILTDEYMILMPQTLPAGAEIVLTCINADGSETAYTTDASGWVWSSGKRITYTFYKGKAPDTIYFDLALANVTINGSSYSGKVYRNGQEETVSGTHISGNNYYVYQSTEANRAGIWDGNVCTPPHYDGITIGGRPWSEFITDNPDVDQVIEAWDKSHTGVATAVGRQATEHWIGISGAVTCNLTIDNIFSTYQDVSPTNRTTAGITFVPTRGNNSVTNAVVTVKIVGDNRIGAVHYANNTTANNGNQIVFEGNGTLTVADVDGNTMAGSPGSEVGLDSGKGYWSNHWSSAIGGHDDSDEQISNGIVINSGIIFAGTTMAENCTAIGGGGNEYGKVTINGGTVTAVATTTGTAIGGGIGYGSPGGEGEVIITGGNVYAYNHANKWNIPSSAIGGAGSRGNYGQKGNVNISGGYVYAESALGTAIGGGSSYSRYGGDAEVTITGGEVIAKTGSSLSASIGGGTACSGNANGTENGGSAKINISGDPIIRAGSVGGGGHGAGRGYIGNATIDISGGDIQAQFLLSAGTGVGQVPSFKMSGGLIRHSNTADTEFLHVMPYGGVVYLENGKVEITGGEIRDCVAQKGGAVYIVGSYDSATNKYSASFSMSGGTIEGNEAIVSGNEEFVGSGGAIYIVDGDVELTGGTIAENMAVGGNGGGVFIRRGSLKIGGSSLIKGNASEIRENDAGAYLGGDGGGVYVYSKVADVDVNIEAGTITGNTAERRGGGLCVIQEGATADAMVTLGTTGGPDSGLNIYDNHALLQGGGVYVKGENAHITINSGTITGNSVSQYVHNQDVANDMGEVTLIGGQIDHRIVTFNANYGETPDTSPQKIVTETNSRLVVPEFTRMGYRLVGWNSKPSGTGDSYTDGQIMNISKNITLYAQWELDV